MMENLTVDGKNIIGNPKETMLLEAIRGAGISISPHCARMKPFHVPAPAGFVWWKLKKEIEQG